ncbi:MAG: glycosyltransferase [Lachnospiraceae bacterium]|nr:glycosyltransferase [Lachnospiraceae bacterium]
MRRILFLIHDLGQGGAEKVLVNLVNNMDDTKFDITVMTLFDCGENRQFLSPKVKYKTWCRRMFRGNSHLMKLLSPETLHRLIIKEHYDIEVAYLEGPCARIISGCPEPSTKLVSWIHIEQHTAERAARSFRSVQEAKRCYSRFDKIVCVSETVEKDFQKALQVDASYEVLYNTNESKKICQASQETVTDIEFQSDEVKLVGVGKLLDSKGFDRILRITKQLLDEKYPVHTYILGDGPARASLQRYIKDNKMERQVTLLGYQLNPYKYIKKCDIFVCASHAEGFSTAATEALILGVPVCTVEVSGMKEMLGEHNEYGLVTDNSEEALFAGIKMLLNDATLMDKYKVAAIQRGDFFSTEKTVRAVEKMLLTM